MNACSCGREGTQYLAISNRWRCADCTAELENVASAAADAGDPLPKDSIGALKPMRHLELHEKVRP